MRIKRITYSSLSFIYLFYLSEICLFRSSVTSSMFQSVSSSNTLQAITLEYLGGGGKKKERITLKTLNLCIWTHRDWKQPLINFVSKNIYQELLRADYLKYAIFFIKIWIPRYLIHKTWHFVFMFNVLATASVSVMVSALASSVVYQRLYNWYLPLHCTQL